MTMYMNVTLKVWDPQLPERYETRGPFRVESYVGLSFRQTDEVSATTVNFNGLRVTEVYLDAKGETIVLYCEKVGKEGGNK
jgi:hypothetical protein